MNDVERGGRPALLSGYTRRRWGRREDRGGPSEAGGSTMTTASRDISMGGVASECEGAVATH